MLQNPLFKITQGLYVLGARDEKNNRFAGSIVDAVMQVSAEPLVIALSCQNISYTRECIEKEGEFMLSILGKDVDPFVIGNFGFQTSRNVDKWGNVEHETVEGLPVIKKCLAVVKAKILKKLPMGSNMLFVAEVVFDEDKDEGEPITYWDYRQGFKNEVFAAFKNAKKS